MQKVVKYSFSTVLIVFIREAPSIFPKKNVRLSTLFSTNSVDKHILPSFPGRPADMHATVIPDEYEIVQTQLQRIKQALSESKSILEIKRLREIAEQMRVDTQQRDLGLELQNQATELKLQAERKLGMSLAEMKLRGGDRKTGRDTVRLKDLGIDKNQSARWQQSASVPDSMFQNYLEATRTTGKELSSAGLLRLAKQLRAEQSTKMPSADLKCRAPAPDFTRLTSTSIQQSNRLPSLAFVDLIDEGKNHVKTLTGLLDHLCERAGFATESGESRACRRYLTEISLNFDDLRMEIQKLATERRFLTANLPS